MRCGRFVGNTKAKITLPLQMYPSPTLDDRIQYKALIRRAKRKHLTITIAYTYWLNTAIYAHLNSGLCIDNVTHWQQQQVYGERDDGVEVNPRGTISR